MVYCKFMAVFESADNRILEEHSCFFCQKSIKRIKDHLVNTHNTQIKLLFEERLQNKTLGEGCTVTQFTTLLIYEARHRDQNLPAMRTNEGILRPSRATETVKQPSQLTICNACKQLVAKKFWSNHCSNCIFLVFLNVRPSVHENKKALINRYILSNDRD